MFCSIVLQPGPDVKPSLPWRIGRARSQRPPPDAKRAPRINQPSHKDSKLRIATGNHERHA